MSLRSLLENRQVSQSRLARDLGISSSAVNRLLLYGVWPKTKVADLRDKFSKLLAGYGLNQVQVQSGLAELDGLSLPGGPVGYSAGEPQQEDFAVSGKYTLSREAKTKFRIPREIFDDNLSGPDDVFFDDNIRYVEQSLYATARFGGLLALMGESGSGKSTIFSYLKGRLEAEGEDKGIRFVEPYVLGMGIKSDRGRSGGLSMGSICEAVLEAFDGGACSHLSTEKRFKLMHGLLQDAYPAVRCVIVIEEAHGLPADKVKMLKRLLELKKGMTRLVSIILIGQTLEMKKLLSPTRADVREVVQRCEFVELEPLANVEKYVRHRCQRAGASFEAIFDKDALGELGLKLSGVPEKGKARGASLLYPLLVGNTLTRAINKAAELGVDKVDAEIIRLA